MIAIPVEVDGVEIVPTRPGIRDDVLDEHRAVEIGGRIPSRRGRGEHACPKDVQSLIPIDISIPMYDAGHSPRSEEFRAGHQPLRIRH
ncbi:MAG: hypothetical protein IPJ77_22080 [Planctomycetes bacterium]|nr:hypothetical protein [Planctomycetota bacterium]